MTRAIAIAAAIVLGCTLLARAQSAPQQSLAAVAKQEEERRKTVKAPAKVYTNDSLRPDISKGGEAPPSPTRDAASTNTTPTNTSPAAPEGATAPARGGDQAYWQGRIKTAREQLQRSQIFADSLQSRINALRTDFVNRDDPAQKAKIKTDLDTALAELERVKKEIDEQTKAISGIEDEARRAGVPPGWLRPGA